VIVQNLDAADTAIDQTYIQVGAIEAVRVSATVSPQITFKIAGLGTSVSACGLTTSVATTPQSVPFGSIAISSFTNAAQSLEVSTNAVGGYAVTAQENYPIKKTGTSTTIADTPGDSGTATYGSPNKWTLTTTKGFGYGLAYIGKVVGSGSVSFSNATSNGSCDGSSFCAKQFADLSNSEPAQTILSSSGVADSENINVCYRIIVSSTQAAGDYDNNVVYTATATF
jgi:hypothetical protein